VVHAKGTGAYGEFEVTHDITNFTSAAFLDTVGKKTRLFTRFSTVAGEKGSADSVRDGRGFAFKLYTDEGNLDWMFFNLVSTYVITSKRKTKCSKPVFFIRDPVKLPSLAHAQKKNPQTNLKDANAVSNFNYPAMYISY
jgi:catalase